MKKRPMNVLFLVHCEEMFDHLFPWGFRERLAQFVQNPQWDKVIALTSFINDHTPIPEVCLPHVQIWEWGWGYEPECFDHDHDPEEATWLINACGHEYTWVPPELRPPNTRDFDSDNITIVGGGRGECLQDFEDVLCHLKIAYDLHDDLTF